MQWLVDLVIEAIGVPPCYIDRGDPAVHDFTAADLVKDGAWHDLDLSSIVPEGASTVNFRASAKANLVDKKVIIKQKGYVNTVSRLLTRTQVAAISNDEIGAIGSNAERVFEYFIDTSPGWGINISVLGWWL